MDQATENGNVNCRNEAKDINEDEEYIADEDVTDGGPIKAKKRTSKIWLHFSTEFVMTIKGRTEIAKCNYCIKQYAVSGKSNASTGNLNRHLKAKHPEKIAINIADQKEAFVFSQEKYREALLKWVVVCNQPFSEVQQEAFLDMIKTLNPEAKTISDKTIKRDIMAKFVIEAEKLKLHISKVPGKISFTIDGWTSKNVLSFLAIRIHFINADWKYESVLLDFLHVDGSHDGPHLGEIFLDCIKRFEIPLSKVMAITMDNVGSNNTFMDYLESQGIKIEVRISAAGNRVRCLAHILNLSIQDIMSELNIALNNGENETLLDDSVDSDGEESGDIDMASEEQSSEHGWEDIEEEPDQPIVSKLRKLVKKIRKSTQMRQKLRKICKMIGISYLTPKIDVSTRWNSTFHMIERAMKLKRALRVLCTNEKSLHSLMMKESEWAELSNVSVLFKKFDRSTKLVSMERHPTIAAYLPTFNWLLESLKTFIQDNPGHLALAVTEGLEKLKKYELELSIQNSKLPFVAVFLNPALKMSYFKEHKFRNVKEIQKEICEIFQRDYQTEADNAASNEVEDSEDEFYAFMFKRAKVTKATKEFQKYIQFPLSCSKIDLLDFWRSQEAEFPNLAKMARDVLPIQSSSTPVERDFSQGADLVTPTRCSLNPETIRACMCLKNWFKDFTFDFC